MSVVLAKFIRFAMQEILNSHLITFLQARDAKESVIPDLEIKIYCILGLTRPLTETKLRYLQYMYRDVYPSDRYPSFLNMSSDA